MRSAPASGPAPQGGADARRGGSTSAELTARYAPILSILTADGGEQINRVAAMMLEIVEARDAEELATNGMVRLAPGQAGAQALDTKYKPLIAILMAKRAVQLDLAKRLQLHVRDARDGEGMKARKVGAFNPG